MAIIRPRMKNAPTIKTAALPPKYFFCIVSDQTKRRTGPLPIEITTETTTEKYFRPLPRIYGKTTKLLPIVVAQAIQ